MLWLTALVPWLLTGPGAACAPLKPVMVHYMPWFVSQPYSGAWGWHWTMKSFHPETVTTNGALQIASWYYPLIGPYDSADPAVLEYHVLLMKLAGIDGVVVDWYGTDNFNDYALNNQRTLALFDFTRRAGLKFCLCYEDQTVQQEINAKFLSPETALAHAQQTMLYAETNFFTDPSFLRISNAPVFLDFGPQYFKDNADWVRIFSVLATTNAPCFFTEDNRLPAAGGAFDWPPMWLSGGGTNTLTPAQLQEYLDGFERMARSWPQYVSSAFPRFHDIYAEGGASPSYGFLDDAGGATLTQTLTRAFTNQSVVAHIVTWNDFGEGTAVEPTMDYGYRDLGIIQNLRRQYLDPSFAYHTNDLACAWRLYNLRKQHAREPAMAAELDGIFTNLVTGNVALAGARLSSLEAQNPTANQRPHVPLQSAVTPAATNLSVVLPGTNQMVGRSYHLQ